MNWFNDYRKMAKDEREYYKEYIYDNEQRIVAMDYDRLIESLKYIATKPEVLNKQTNRHLKLAEEVALSFDNESFHLAHNFYEMKLIDTECMQEFEKINDLFEKIDEDVKNDWSLDYMIRDEKWIAIRNIANDILSKIEMSDNDRAITPECDLKKYRH